MQLTKIVVRTDKETQRELRFNPKELAILSAIGLEQIPSATSFVEFIAETYEVSQSGVWYTLKKLKEKRVVDFTEKGEEQKYLALTELGVAMLRKHSAPRYEQHAHAAVTLG